MEQELASRQQQIKLQAEEAQKLRKRKKAEIMRLSNMEKRQKQRLEEVRASQKQDEANLNLKEQLRSEIIKELKVLEMRCFDMASLLRSLGVPVEGGMHPSPQQVHAAYKRAVLKFHPDRTSGSNLKQQVEAEEKFKLISRMKEKYKFQ
uniref:J domain-containing protein n=1 Tax=Kalanchoe fedtschenkoi TaxID=63787 RepID=A0A7N0TUI3_KALFE